MPVPFMRYLTSACLFQTRVSELQLENPHAVDQSFTSVFSSKFSEELMGSLLSRMTSMTVEDGTILYEFGSFGAEAFLVDSGEIELIPFKMEEAHKEPSMRTSPSTPNPELMKTISLSARSMSLDSRGNSRKIIRKGQSFGVMALFPDICQYRAETAKVRTKNGSPAEVLVLSKDDFEEIAQEHPELKDVLREYAELSAVEMRQKKTHLEIKRMNLKSRELGMGEFDLQVTKFRHELRLNAIKRMNLSGADTFQVYMSSDGQEQEKLKVNSLIPSASATGLGLTMGSDKTPLTTRLGRIVTLESGANGSPFEVATGWQLSTCWITDEGELQYFHDSEEGLVTETCSSHGFMIPGRSTVEVDSSPDLTGYYTARMSIFKSKTSKVSKLISIKAPDANDFRPLEDHLSKSASDTNNPATSAKFKSAFGKLKLKSVMAIGNAGKMGSSSKLPNHVSSSSHAQDNDVDIAAASAGANAGEAQSNRKPYFEIGSGEDGAASELRIELSNSELQLASPIRTTNSGNFDSVSQRRQEGATAEALEKHRIDIKADMDRLSDRVYGVERKVCWPFPLSIRTLRSMLRSLSAPRAKTGRFIQT
jgi:CRP-like cAMP-binding protein